MALSKQSIRKGTNILVNGEQISKEELITISELWDDRQENFFRKMMKQGGKFSINKVPYEISIEQDGKLRSDGTRESSPIKIPGEDSRF